MADGFNQARALRVLEIMNDFRTLQVHIRQHINTARASPPAAQDRNLMGYQMLVRCQGAAETILAANFNAGQVAPGSVDQTDAQKRVLQRVILDASVRRFKAHKIYLMVSAVMRWIQGRRQVLGSEQAAGRHEAMLRALDQRLQTEASAISNEVVFSNLRQGDRNRGYWLDEDPTMSAIIAQG